MPYTIRPVPISQFPIAADIWSLAFGMPGYLERQLEYASKQLSILVGAYDGEDLQGVAGVIDFQLHLGERWIPCGGVAAVATSPPHRRQGIVKALLADCLRQLHERRVPIAALWPFSYKFYQRMGWAVTDLQYGVELRLQSIGNDGDSTAYKQIPLTGYGPLMALHERWVENYNLSMKRSACRWERRLTEPEFEGRLFLHDDGYMIWDVKKREGNTLRVREWVYLSRKAFLDGLALLKQMDSQFDKAYWTCGEIESLLCDGVTDPRPQITVTPGMMSRVVHLDAFRESLPVKSPPLNVRDPLGVTGSATEPGCDPGALVQLVTGFWRDPPGNLPAQLHGAAAGRISFSAEQY